MDGSRNYTAKYPLWKKLRNHTIIGSSLLGAGALLAPVAAPVMAVWWIHTVCAGIDLINGDDAS